MGSVGANGDRVLEGHWRALRLVNPSWVKLVDGSPRPMSANFQDRKESQAMSVFIEELMEREKRTVEELRALFSGHFVCYHTVDALQKEFKQIIVLERSDRFPGHALVRDQTGKRSQATKSRMAKLARWHERGAPPTPK
jgi:hypothetical protein